MNLLENMEKLNGPNSAAEAAEKEVRKNSISKKEKRRQKMAAKEAQNQDGNAPEAEGKNEDAKKNINDVFEIMFTQNQQNEEFDVSEIFMEPSISLSVVKSPESSVLNLTPR